MMIMDDTTTRDVELLAAENEHVAHNYHPLDVVVSSGSGAVLTDTQGAEYLDFLAAYSATNFGHGHPILLAAAREQLERVTLTSRAFHHDRLAPFAEGLSALIGKEMVLPMNTGAEAVESGIKVARKWGYEVKGVPDGQAKIIVAKGNFHGRTTTIISFSDDPVAHDHYGPYTPGFISVPYGDLEALRNAITDDVVAVLIEPIQGEAGVLIPPAGYLAGVRELCTRNQVLFIADEIQSGLGRTGRTLACEHEDVVADVYLLGKALGGGIVPVSAVVADHDVLGVLRPGQHGSTFGGNPLACAVGLAVVRTAADRRVSRARHPPRSAPAPPARCHDRQRSRRGAVPGIVGGRGHRSEPRQRSRRVRGAGPATRAGQGHPRIDDPAGSADRDHRGATRPGSRSTRTGAGRTRPPLSPSRVARSRRFCTVRVKLALTARNLPR